MALCTYLHDSNREHTFLEAENSIADLGTTFELSAGVYDVTFTNPLNDVTKRCSSFGGRRTGRIGAILEDTPLMLSVP
ncbi:MAG: hypothetical protein R2788_03495 [Saprospiraceae bacterium]